jgi:hypothetical protein
MEELVEPPVPANLQKLSPALQAFADLFELDGDLIAAAAMESPGAQVQEEPIAMPIWLLDRTKPQRQLIGNLNHNLHRCPLL